MKLKNEDAAAAAIRRKVEGRFKARGELQTHAVAYIATNAFLWLIWLMTGADFPWPLFATGGWGIGMAVHAINYYSRYGGGAQKREAQIEAEVERELARLAAREDLSERRLRDEAAVYSLDNYQERGLRLSDDGELLDRGT